MCVCVYSRYLVFYCPQDVVYSCSNTFPLRLVLTGMKEVTRTWKVLGGVAQAHSNKDGLLVMIAIGWAKGTVGIYFECNPHKHSLITIQILTTSGHYMLC
jgi:hypothetical protein